MLLGRPRAPILPAAIPFAFHAQLQKALLILRRRFLELNLIFAFGECAVCLLPCRANFKVGIPVGGCAPREGYNNSNC